MRLCLIQIAVFASLVALPLVAPAPTYRQGVPEAGLVYTAIPPNAGSAQWDKAQLFRLLPDGTQRLLTAGFHSAADPEISFDGKRIAFAGKRTAGARWQIFESDLDGGDLRQLTRMEQDCRHPVYQSRFFTLDAPTPWDQVAFVAGGQLYTVPLKESRAGSATPTRISSFWGEALEPVVAPDGRVIFATREGAGLAYRLFGVNLDGTDYALFNGESKHHLRHAAILDHERMLVVEATPDDPWGAGDLSVIRLARPQRSLAPAALPDGVHLAFPNGLPGGGAIASAQVDGRFALVTLDSDLRKITPLWRDAQHHLLQAQPVAPRPLPDGRGSVVDPAVDWALLYCLNVYTTDPKEPALPPGSVAKVRVLRFATSGGDTLGEAPVEADGSFHVRVPANLPVRLELLGGDGEIVRRSGAWIYARNKEARGCIGCHEDPELSPANRVPLAVTKPPVDLTGTSPPTAAGGGQ